MTLELKDIISLVTAITGFVFSLAAYRRAKAADERSVQAEKRTLLDAIASERENVLGEIYTARAAWKTRQALVRMYNPSDNFLLLVQTSLNDLSLAESAIKREFANMSTHEDLMNFRTRYGPRLQENRTQDTVIEKTFEELLGTIKPKPIKGQ